MLGTCRLLILDGLLCRLFLRAIGACPWSKAVWCDGLALLNGTVPPKELSGQSGSRLACGALDCFGWGSLLLLGQEALARPQMDSAIYGAPALEGRLGPCSVHACTHLHFAWGIFCRVHGGDEGQGARYAHRRV